MKSGAFSPTKARQKNTITVAKSIYLIVMVRT